MTREEALVAEKDLLSGLNLLRLGPSGAMDDLAVRSIVAMDQNNEDEMIHLGALLLNDMRATGKPVPDFANARWGELSRDFHNNRCDECKLAGQSEPPTVTPGDPA